MKVIQSVEDGDEIAELELVPVYSCAADALSCMFPKMNSYSGLERGTKAEKDRLLLAMYHGVKAVSVTLKGLVDPLDCGTVVYALDDGFCHT